MVNVPGYLWMVPDWGVFVCCVHGWYLPTSTATTTTTTSRHQAIAILGFLGQNLCSVHICLPTSLLSRCHLAKFLTISFVPQRLRMCWTWVSLYLCAFTCIEVRSMSRCFFEYYTIEKSHWCPLRTKYVDFLGLCLLLTPCVCVCVSLCKLILSGTYRCHRPTPPPTAAFGIRTYLKIERTGRTTCQSVTMEHWMLWKCARAMYVKRGWYSRRTKTPHIHTYTRTGPSIEWWKVTLRMK